MIIKKITFLLLLSATNLMYSASIGFNDTTNSDCINTINLGCQIDAFLNLNKGRILYATGGHGISTINIFDLNREYKQSFLAHENLITSLISIDEHIIASCSLDGSIKIWNIDASEGDKLLNTLSSHSDLIRGISKLGDNKIISWSSQNRCKIWNVDNKSENKCLLALNDHRYAFDVGYSNYVATIHSDNAFVGYSINQDMFEYPIFYGYHNMSYSIYPIILGIGCCVFALDNQIEIWDLNRSNEQGCCVRKFVAHDDIRLGSIRCLLKLSYNRFASGTLNGEIKIWDLDAKEDINLCVNELKGNFSPITCLLDLSNNLIASGSQNGTVMVWDITHKEAHCIAMLKGHPDIIRHLINLDKGKIAIVSYDGTMKIWTYANA